MKKSNLTVKYQERLNILIKLFGNKMTIAELQEAMSYINSQAS